MNLIAQDMINANIARDEVAKAYPEWNLLALSENLQKAILAVACVASAMGRGENDPDPFVGHEPSESEFWTAEVYEMQDYRDRYRA